MSCNSRLSVTDANRYGLKANRPRGVVGKKALYNSAEYGVRRLNGDLPGEVALDVEAGGASYPVKKNAPDNCGC